MPNNSSLENLVSELKQKLEGRNERICYGIVHEVYMNRRCSYTGIMATMVKLIQKICFQSHYISWEKQKYTVTTCKSDPPKSQRVS